MDRRGKRSCAGRGAPFWAIALALLADLGCSQGSDNRPNIVVILSDDHAVSMMSAYDSHRAQTPNLDRIARDGALFRNAFVTNSICSPARATLLTGLYSHANGVYRNDAEFDGSQTTFPKLLQAAGYATALIGKWHLASPPTGFDYWNVLIGQGSYHDPPMSEMGTVREREGYVTELITDDALRWLRARDSKKPFLLLHHHKAPHAEWVPSEKNKTRFSDETVPLPPTFNASRRGRARPGRMMANRLVPDLLRRWVLLGEEFGKKAPEGLSGLESRGWIYQEFLRDYRRVLLSVDESAGQILDFLDAEGLSDNTIVVYTSDNGMLLGERDMFDKRLMYEESLRVPLVVRYPASIAAGTDIEATALNVDIAPTLLDFAGVAIPAATHGRSLRGWLEGTPPPEWRQSFYYQYYEEAGYHNVPPHHGVRTARFKLIHYTGSYVTELRSAKSSGPVDEWELIDLAADPSELQNVYNDSRYAGVVEELKQELERLRSELGVPSSDADVAVAPAG